MAAHFVYWRPLMASCGYKNTETVMLLLHKQVVVSATYVTLIFFVPTWPQQSNNGKTEQSVSYVPWHISRYQRGVTLAYSHAYNAAQQRESDVPNTCSWCSSDNITSFTWRLSVNWCQGTHIVVGSIDRRILTFGSCRTWNLRRQWFPGSDPSKSLCYHDRARGATAKW